MKHFGTVQSFDTNKGQGEIKPESGGDPLRFEKSAISWEDNKPPTVGQRLSYELENDSKQPRAVNLQTA